MMSYLFFIPFILGGTVCPMTRHAIKLIENMILMFQAQNTFITLQG